MNENRGEQGETATISEKRKSGSAKAVSENYDQLQTTEQSSYDASSANVLNETTDTNREMEENKAASVQAQSNISNGIQMAQLDH